MPSLKKILEDMSTDLKRLDNLEKQCAEVILANERLAQTNAELREENATLKAELHGFRQTFVSTVEDVAVLKDFMKSETEIR